MNKPGNLYVTATPIGNLDDITIRALKILQNVDIVAAEDTRHTARLFIRHHIETPMVSFHEHNENQRKTELVEKMAAGQSVALVSDAGTPGVSDPGFRLVEAAVEHGITVVPIPGPCAAVAALSASGLPTDQFRFIGFPPKKQGKRTRLLESLTEDKATIIFYESPNAIQSFIRQIIEILGDRPAVLAREISKIHEEFIRDHLSVILESLDDRPAVKGECTLLISGSQEPVSVSAEILETTIREHLEKGGQGLSAMSKTIARTYGLPRKQVYDLALKLKGEKADINNV